MKGILNKISVYFICMMLAFTTVSEITHAVGDTKTNLALNKVATSSGNETDTLTPEKAVDGSLTTKWAGPDSSRDPQSSDEQWFQVDLGKVETINEIIINYEEVPSYEIQTSSDGTTWNTIFSETNGGNSTKTTKELKFIDTDAKYVRFLQHKRAVNKNGTKYSACIFELEVYNNIETEEEKEVTKIEDSEVTTKNELFKFQYTGSWRGETGYPVFSNGDDHYSDKNNPSSYYEVTFIGNKVEIYGTKRNSHGDYNVYIDGEFKTTASAYLDTPDGTIKEHQVNLCTIEGLEEGLHTLKVTLADGVPQARQCIQVDYVNVYHKEFIPTSITLSDEEFALQAGSSKSLEVNYEPWYASKGNIEWTSSDENAVKVNENGLVTAVGKEEATVIVTAAIAGTNLKAESIVHVIPEVEYLYSYVGDVNKLEIQEDYDKLWTGYTKEFSDTAWRGDFLSSKIVVTTKKATNNVEITATDFMNEKGDVLDSSNIEIRWLKEVLANIGNSYPSAPVKEFPDVIHKGGKINIEENRARFAWVTINVPMDTEPGVYTGTLTVNADELTSPYTFNYEIEVLDLEQPTVDDTNTSVQIWQHPFSVAGYYGVSEEDYFTEEHFKYLRPSMKEYYELGGRDVAANIVEEAWNHQSYYGDPSMVKWRKKTDGSFEFDYTWYDAWINFQIECGVINPEKGIGQIKCFSIVPWNNQVAYFDESTNSMIKKSYTPGTEDWKQIWTAFLTDFMKHSTEKGWLDITYISMDERPMDSLIPTVELIKSLRNEEGKTLKISSCFNYVNNASSDFTDKIDDISISINHFSHEDDVMREFSEHRKELGLLTTIYTCQNRFPSSYTISDPANNYWVMWDSLSQKTNGFLRWAWDSWVADPLTNVTYSRWEPGDPWFVYPVEKDNTSNSDYFYSTPRYETMKKGIYDINKAKFLMEKSDELNTTLTDLAQSMTMPEYKKEYNSTVPKTEKDRQLLFSDVNRLHAGLMDCSKTYLNSKADYSKVDEAIASVPSDLTVYTDESQAALQEALDAVVRDLDVTKQAEVDEMAEAINAAIANLEKSVYTITVNGEVVYTGAYNEKVTVTAPVVEGKEFTGWLLNGKIVSTKASYTFFISEDMEFTPCYEAVEMKAEALLTNTVLTRREDGKADIKFVAQLVVPVGYTVKDAGLVWSSKEEAELSLDNENLKPTYINTISNTNQFSVTIKGMPKGKFIRGRIIATLVDDEGNETVVYSDETRVVNK